MLCLSSKSAGTVVNLYSEGCEEDMMGVFCIITMYLYDRYLHAAESGRDPTIF